jgi:hypothetical protein
MGSEREGCFQLDEEDTVGRPIELRRTADQPWQLADTTATILERLANTMSDFASEFRNG